MTTYQPDRDEKPPTLHECLAEQGVSSHQRDRAARAFSRWLGTWRQDPSVDEAALNKLQLMIGLGH